MPSSDQATFWRKLFKERPDLNPPGYDETVAKMYPPKEDDDEDCEIEF